LLPLAFELLDAPDPFAGFQVGQEHGQSRTVTDAVLVPRAKHRGPGQPVFDVLVPDQHDLRRLQVKARRGPLAMQCSIAGIVRNQ